DTPATRSLVSTPTLRLRDTGSRNAAYTAAPKSTAPIVIAIIFLRIIVRPFRCGIFPVTLPPPWSPCGRGRAMRPRRRVLEGAAQDRISGSVGDDDGCDRADRIRARREHVSGLVVQGQSADTEGDGDRAGGQAVVEDHEGRAVRDEGAHLEHVVLLHEGWRYGLGPDAYPSVRRDDLAGRRGDESDRLVTIGQSRACDAQRHRQAECCCCQCSHCLPLLVPEAPTPRGVHAACSFIGCDGSGRPFAPSIDLPSPPHGGPRVDMRRPA